MLIQVHAKVVLQGGVGGAASAALAAVVAANHRASGQGMGARPGTQELKWGIFLFAGTRHATDGHLHSFPPSALYKASSLAGSVSSQVAFVKAVLIRGRAPKWDPGD